MNLEKMNLENNTLNLYDSFQVIANAKDSESEKAMVVCKSLKAPEQYLDNPF
jgi:hypothetical protein